MLIEFLATLGIRTGENITTLNFLVVMINENIPRGGIEV